VTEKYPTDHDDIFLSKRRLRDIPSTVRWDVGGTARSGCDPPSTDAMLLSWPGLVDLGAGGVVCVCGRAA
jgi:hypothetical protein